MTAADRNRVRLELDQQARARIAAFIKAGELETCKGCGAELDCTTRGCKRCMDRHLKLALRQNPEWRARDQVRQKGLRERARRAAGKPKRQKAAA